MNKIDWQQNINRTNLIIARKNIGLSTMDATKKVIPQNPKKLDRVKSWELGDTNPTYNQLEKLAKTYNVNPFQLLLEDTLRKTKPPIAFRSDPAKTGGYNLNKFISILRLRQAIIGLNLKRDNAPKHALVGSGSKYKNPEDLAGFIRQKINYDIQQKPKEQEVLKYFRSLLHDQFIFVFKTLSYNKIDPDEMKGMYLHDSHAPFIALNRSDYKAAQVFTLAHELAHLFRAEERIDSIEFRIIEKNLEPEEVFCNKVAASLLIPRNQIPKHRSWSLEEVKELATTNHVSNLVALYRLSNLNLINKSRIDNYFNQFNQEYKEYQQKQSAVDQSGGHYYNNMRDSNGELFSEFIFSMYQTGELSAVEAQNLLKIPLTEIGS